MQRMATVVVAVPTILLGAAAPAIAAPPATEKYCIEEQGQSICMVAFLNIAGTPSASASKAQVVNVQERVTFTVTEDGNTTFSSSSSSRRQASEVVRENEPQVAVSQFVGSVAYPGEVCRYQYRFVLVRGEFVVDQFEFSCTT